MRVIVYRVKLIFKVKNKSLSQGLFVSLFYMRIINHAFNKNELVQNQEFVYSHNIQHHELTTHFYKYIRNLSRVNACVNDSKWGSLFLSVVIGLTGSESLFVVVSVVSTRRHTHINSFLNALLNNCLIVGQSHQFRAGAVAART